MVWNLKKFPTFAKEEIIKIIDGEKKIRQDVITMIEKDRKEIEKSWPTELKTHVFKYLKEN